MERIISSITLAGLDGKHFSGTVTLRDDDRTLPDGSKMSLGVDGRRWVLLYQMSTSATFQQYLYDAETGYIEVDGSRGSVADVHVMMRHIDYFFAHTNREELVTLQGSPAQCLLTLN